MERSRQREADVPRRFPAFPDVSRGVKLPVAGTTLATGETCFDEDAPLQVARLMHIGFVTAGGAGMFCGSCMHDNTLARSLRESGEQVTLIPTYTPIRVDEENVSQSRVLLGGLNIYLNAASRLWRYLPRWTNTWLDHPAIIRWATRFAVSADAEQLGSLTVALLQGEAGPERVPIQEFARSLAQDIRPDLVLYTNALLVGTLRSLKAEFSGPVLCLLQGDDVFLDDLVEPYRSAALRLLRERVRDFDGFLVHSQYYRDHMSRMLEIPSEKIEVVPLGIDLRGHTGHPREAEDSGFTVGYFARICPEKGLHRLVAGFRILRSRHPQVRLRVGGYLGARDREYFARVRREAADLGSAFEYVGSPATHVEKVAFYQSLDVLSVPTEYHEPKGLYVLEAWANGIPVVQPRHGAFPELLAATGGGVLVPPGDAVALAEALEKLLTDRGTRFQYATAGWKGVRARYNREVMVRETLPALEKHLAAARHGTRPSADYPQARASS